MGQKPIIKATLSGQDIFAVLPTGSGKSLCYQLPAVLEGKVTVVISPLLALMQDQVFEMEQIGVKAASIGSHQSRKTESEILDAVLKGEYQLLYITPERLLWNHHTQNLISRMYANDQIGRFAIDEAHCASQWGHDFRKDYGRLDLIRAMWPKVPIIAVTATATRDVMADVIRILDIDDCQIFAGSFDRPNIYMSVRRKAKKSELPAQISKMLEACTGAVIIYSLTTKEVDYLNEKLSLLGLKVVKYHSKMTKIDREMSHARWKDGNAQIMIATVAFGMGVNKLDVRLIINASMPKSIENYWQMAGRGGRDGLMCESIILYSGSDFRIGKFLIEKMMRRLRETN